MTLRPCYNAELVATLCYQGSSRDWNSAISTSFYFRTFENLDGTGQNTDRCC